MKNLNNIGLDPGKLIPQEQLINLKGGEELRECWHITCIDSVGEWYGMYDSFVSAVLSGGYWCESTSIHIEPSSDPICDLMD